MSASIEEVASCGSSPLGEAAQNGLAADDKYIRLAGDRRSGAKDMLKLLAVHAACA